MIIFRAMFLIIWAGVIFLLTCVSNFRELTNSREIEFTFQGSPDLSMFFSKIPVLTDGFVIQKMGHILAFLFLAIIVYSCFQSYYITFCVCVFYGFITEFLQLYFSRGGRLFDVGIDAVGVLIGIFYTVIVMHLKRNAEAKDEEVGGLTK